MSLVVPVHGRVRGRDVIHGRIGFVQVARLPVGVVGIDVRDAP
jgi:hypothetical protein